MEYALVKRVTRSMNHPRISKDTSREEHFLLVLLIVLLALNAPGCGTTPTQKYAETPQQHDMRRAIERADRSAEQRARMQQDHKR